MTNRGNDRRRLFFNDADFNGFVELLGESAPRFSVELHGYCVMPNHFHLLVHQREPGALSAYIHRISGISARLFRESTDTVGLGHVYQRRFWSRPLGHESDYLMALRYVEANPLRAELVSRAEDWPWGSLWERLTGGRKILTPAFVGLPPEWKEIVNAVQPPKELELLRAQAKRGRPRARSATR